MYFVDEKKPKGWKHSLVSRTTTYSVQMRTTHGWLLHKIYERRDKDGDRWLGFYRGKEQHPR